MKHSVFSFALPGTWTFAAASFCFLGLFLTSVPAQQAPIVYPSQGQTAEQQALDETECRAFAQQTTGFNPSQVPSSTAAAPVGGEMIGGSARGAALGAIGGAIAGDAGKGAAIGAGVGATGGLFRKKQQQVANQQAQAQAASAYNANLSNYYRAFGACMQGRSYAVN